MTISPPLELVYPCSGSTMPVYKLSGGQPGTTTNFYNNAAEWNALKGGCGEIEVNGLEAEHSDSSPNWNWRFNGQLLKIGGVHNLTWKGGSIKGSFANLSWSIMHDTYAISLTDVYNTVIRSMHIYNTGDGFSLSNASCDEGTYTQNLIQGARDDAIQNDFGCTGVFAENFVLGCYVFYSSRPFQSNVTNNNNKVFFIDNNLVYLQDMPTGFSGPGHGRFFKMDNAAQAGWPGSPRDPQLEMSGNILMLDTMPVCCGDFILPPASRFSAFQMGGASMNTLIWGGASPIPSKIQTEYMSTFSSKFTVVTGAAARSFWSASVQSWLDRGFCEDQSIYSGFGDVTAPVGIAPPNRNYPYP